MMMIMISIIVTVLNAYGVHVLQLIIIYYGIEFLWTKSGALIGYFGFGPEYEVVFLILIKLFNITV